MRMLRRKVALLAALAMLIAACGEAADDSDEGGSADGDEETEDAEDPAEEDGEEDEEASSDGITEPVVIGWTPSALSPTDFFGLYQLGLEQELDALGVEYELITRAAPRQDAHEAQFQIVEELITLDVDVILQSPTSFEQQQGAFKNIDEAGIPLIIPNQNRPDNHDELGFDVLQYTAYSHREGGQVLADYLRDTLEPGTDQMVVLRGVDGDTVDVDRSEPVLETAEELGVEVVTQEWANYMQDEAFNATTNIMAAYPDTTVIYAISSAMAAGAIAALENLGLEPGVDVDVWGYGGTPEELENIMDGKQTGTLFRDPMEMGAASAQAIKKLVDGDEEEVEQYFEATMVLLTSCEDIVEHVPAATFGGEEDAPSMDDC